MPLPDTPYTRKEAYLNAIATGDSGGIPETPYTREEMYLDAIARNGGGGGGGSSTLSGLTDVDISNPSDGQTLVYDASSGKWENGSGGGGGGSSDRVILIAENGTLPMTYSAIFALYTQGKDIIVVDTFSEGVGEQWEYHETAQGPVMSMTYTPNAEDPEVSGDVYAVNTTGSHYGVYYTSTIDGYPSRNDD